MTDHAPAGKDQVAASAALTAEEFENRQSLYATVSREMVRLYKEQFGRGPTKSRTAFADRDCLICTLEDSLTPAEKNMVALGEHQRLRDIRAFFQHAAEDDFTETIERLTGRKVRGFVSGIDTARDISSEVFYLQPSES